MKKFELSEPALAQLLQYIQSRPYSEVANLVKVLEEELRSQVEQAQEEKKEEVKEEVKEEPKKEVKSVNSRSKSKKA